MKSLFKLGGKDIIKGLLMTLITAILTAVYSSLEAGHFPVTLAEWKPIAISAAGAAIAYLLKNWLTNSKDQFLKPEEKKG